MRTRTSARRQQGGFGILSALLALVIGSIIMVGQIEGIRTATAVRAGALQGDLLNTIKAASNHYAIENYLALQNDQAVVKNGVTLATGNTSGQTLSPTVGDLVTMGYLNVGTSATASIVDGTYRIRFEKLPAGCTATSPVCNVTGILYVDRPVRGRANEDLNVPAIGTIIEKVGGDALVSLNVNANQLAAASGAAAVNPLGSQPGVIGARIGFGSMGFGAYLIMNDPRDPNFQGDVTVKGEVTAKTVTAIETLKGGTVGAGEGTTGCLRGEIGSNGVFESRTADCVRGAWVNGEQGQVGVADLTGAMRAYMDGRTATMAIRDAAGTDRAGFNWTGGESVAYADQLRNTTNTAGIRSDGKVFGVSGEFNTIVVNSSAVPGSPCPTQNAAVWGVVADTPVLLKCEAGAWIPAGGQPVATVGQACSVQNRHGVTQEGIGLICQGGTWIQLADRMGSWAFASSYLVENGSVVPKPTCGNGGIPRIYAVPQAINSSKLYSNFYASETPSSWTMLITDNLGSGLSGRAIAQTGCIY